MPPLALHDLGAGRTEAVKHDVMAFKAETARGELRQIRGTAVDLEDANAGAAAEVVVVPLARHFIARRFAGQGDRLQPAICNQRFEVAVHRGDTQSRHVGLGGRKHFLGAQRAVDFFKKSCVSLGVVGCYGPWADYTRST